MDVFYSVLVLPTFSFYPFLLSTHYNKLMLRPPSGSLPTFEKYCVQGPSEFQNDWEKGRPQRAGEVSGQSWDLKVLLISF